MKLLAAPPTKIQNKALAKYELDRYFQANSVESLLVTLQHGKRLGLFNFDITISADYLDWAKAKHDLLNPTAHGLDLGFTKPHRLYDLSGKIQNGESLNEEEIRRVITELPHETLERYLRFCLREIDYEDLRDYIIPRPQRTNTEEDYGHLAYNGLEAKGAMITYAGIPIHMGFQHRQVVRAFLKRPDRLLAPDIFIEDPDIFNPNSDYPNVRETLGKLIPAVHKKLKAVIGKECIINEPNEGWRLKIE